MAESFESPRVAEILRQKYSAMLAGSPLVQSLMAEPRNMALLSGVLADWQIEYRLALPKNNPYHLTIQPFALPTKEPGQVSWGRSSYGYDLRLGRKYLVFNDTAATLVDPKNFDESKFERREGGSCIIPPNSFLLAESLEYFEIPEDTIAIVLGKSTYARCGIGLTMTPLEPGWRGIVTIEIANHTRLPAVLHSGEGIGQVLFFEGAAPCELPYNAKKGASYQDQPGLVGPRA